MEDYLKNTFYGSFIFVVTTLVGAVNKDYKLSKEVVYKMMKTARFPFTDDPYVFQKICKEMQWDYEVIKQTFKEQHFTLFRIKSKWNEIVLPAIKTEDLKKTLGKEYNPGIDDEYTILPNNSDFTFPQTYQKAIEIKEIEW